MSDVAFFVHPRRRPRRVFTPRRRVGMVRRTKHWTLVDLLHITRWIWSLTMVRAQSDTFVPSCAEESFDDLLRLCDPNAVSFSRDACCTRLAMLNAEECFCNANLGDVDFEVRRRVLPEVLRAERRCDLKLKFGNECVPLPEFSAPISPPPPPPPPQPSAITTPALVSSRIQASCTPDGLVSMVQFGCSAITEPDSPFSQRVKVTCCDALIKLNDMKCFCEESDMIRELLRTFSANFGAMFKSAPSVCGATIVGGWQCLPFVDRTPPSSPPPPPPIRSPPPAPSAIQRAPLPPFIGRTFGLDAALESRRREIQTRICTVAAFANILDSGCARLPFLDASTNRASRCCELISLMNSGLCFCRDDVAALVASARAVSDPMLAATTQKCSPGFQTYAYEECSIVDRPLPASPPPPPATPPPSFAGPTCTWFVGMLFSDSHGDHTYCPAQVD